MKKKTKIILIILSVLLAAGIAGISYRIHIYREDSKPKYCELTDKEREFLNAFRDYNGRDMERFREGMLYEYEIMQLDWLRRVYADLEERYPGYQFYISDKTAPGMFGPAGYSLYYTKEETTGREFDTHAYFKDGDYAYEEDNFYAYFVEEEYAAYVGELLKEKGVDKIAKTGGIMLTAMGKECDGSITVEEIVNEHIEKMSPAVRIYLATKGMTEEECKKQGEEIQEKLEEIDLRGIYYIHFCDMTEEEIVSSEDMIDIYIHSCESWNWGKEENK